jgi:hypothetical protein
VRVCACVRACVRACVCVRASQSMGLRVEELEDELEVQELEDLQARLHSLGEDSDDDGAELEPEPEPESEPEPLSAD